MIGMLASPLTAETIIAARTVPANSIIEVDDLSLSAIDISGGVDDLQMIVGMEARVALYAGRPIRLRDVSPPAIVERNQLINLTFSIGGLVISTEGRSLARASEGDVIRVMNLSSRTTVSARIGKDGAAYVSN